MKYHFQTEFLESLFSHSFKNESPNSQHYFMGEAKIGSPTVM
jgi:hypothetical protein